MFININIPFLTCVLSCVSVSADEGWFWHVTDFHWDFSYWNQQLSCNGVGPQHPGMFGDEWCDSPWKLIEETITGMHTIKQDVDFVLWTGDSVPHVSDTFLSQQMNEELVSNITTSMKSAFPHVYATFGNHDYYKSNQYPPHGNQIYNDTYDIWKTWIGDTSQEAYFLKGGYYSVLVPGTSIRIVALNTNMYYYKDTVTQALLDPADQFAWLEQVLTAARNNNEKVILTGHVPPGYSTPRAVRWMTPAFNNRLTQIMVTHSDVIKGAHFGHEHHDNFRILHNNTGTPLVTIFIAPSVTPWRYRIGDKKEPAHNPGARLVKYDKVTGNQLDIVQYYIDLQASNMADQVVWRRGYNATQMYAIKDLTPASMQELTSRMDMHAGPEFQAYVNWYNTNGTDSAGTCDAKCHKVVMCGARNLDDDSFGKCVKNTPCPPGSDGCPIVG